MTRSRLFRLLALVLAALSLWTLPQIVAGFGGAGVLEAALLLIAGTGAVVLIPLFFYYAIRGPEAADRLLGRLGLRR